MNNLVIAKTMPTVILDPVEQVKPIARAKESYGFVNTRQILDTFAESGWEVESIQKQKVRLTDKDGFQKHLVWLKNKNLPEIKGLSKDNSTELRLCLVNSHDLTSALNIFFGLMRVACLNQLLAGKIFRYFRASHSRNVVSKLGEGIEYMTNGIPELVENLKKLQAITMTEDQRMEYAKRLIDLRMAGVNNLRTVDYKVAEKARRSEDEFQDGYTVLNRVQELVIRGGIPYSYERQKRNPETGEVVETKIIHTTTKKLASIPSQLKLNQSLISEIYSVTGAKISA
jgi:hypothetical protein